MSPSQSAGCGAPESDVGGRSVAVDSATLQLTQDGDVIKTFDMRHTGAGYMAMVSGAPRGSYDLRLVLDIDGFEAVVDGPTLRVG